MGREICNSLCRAVGDFVRSGAGDDAANGGVLPSHHDFCAAGESADFAVAGGADARGIADAALAGDIAGGGGGSGDGGGAGDAFWSGVGASVWIDGAGRFSNSKSAVVAVGSVLRAARSSDCTGAREFGRRRKLAW